MALGAQAASVACLHLARSVVFDALRQVVQILGQIVEEFDYVAGVLRVGGGFDCAGMGGRPAEDANLVGPVLNERRQETLRRSRRTGYSLWRPGRAALLVASCAPSPLQRVAFRVFGKEKRHEGKTRISRHQDIALFTRLGPFLSSAFGLDSAWAPHGDHRFVLC
jgi:hypothetical protein